MLHRRLPTGCQALRSSRLTLLLLALLLWPLAASGQQSAEGGAASAVEELAEELELPKRISDLEDATEMDDELRKRLLELYRSAQEKLTAAASYAATTLELEQLVSTAPAQIQHLQQQIEQLRATTPAIDGELAE